MYDRIAKSAVVAVWLMVAVLICAGILPFVIRMARDIWS